MNKVIEIKFGSHLYGTDTENSDLDIKGIYLPTAQEIVLGRYKKTIQVKRPKAHGERNTKDDVDTEFISLDRFLELLAEGQTMALDMLFAPSESLQLKGEDFSYTRLKLWDTLWQNKDKLLHKNVNAFVGYARQQAAKYGIKGSRMDALKRVIAVLESLPDACDLRSRDYWIDGLIKECSELVSLEKEPIVRYVECNGPNGLPQKHLEVCGRKIPLTATVKYAKQVYSKVLNEYGARSTKAHLDGGKDWKALSHAVRVAGEAVELLTTGHITFPRPDAQLLKDIKQGKVEYDEVAALIEKGLVDLIEAQKVSTLRDQADQDWIDTFVYNVYSSVVKESL